MPNKRHHEKPPKFDEKGAIEVLIFTIQSQMRADNRQPRVNHKHKNRIQYFEVVFDPFSPQLTLPNALQPKRKMTSDFFEFICGQLILLDLI